MSEITPATGEIFNMLNNAEMNFRQGVRMKTAARCSSLTATTSL
ncbi:MAG: hypothetical protein ACOX4I_09465 [Anaerovoracaceae bacterium]